MANDLGHLRRSQIITSHGPGSVIDFRAGGAGISVVASGLEQWDNFFALPDDLKYNLILMNPPFSLKSASKTRFLVLFLLIDDFAAILASLHNQ